MIISIYCFYAWSFLLVPLNHFPSTSQDWKQLLYKVPWLSPRLTYICYCSPQGGRYCYHRCLCLFVYLFWRIEIYKNGLTKQLNSQGIIHTFGKNPCKKWLNDDKWMIQNWPSDWIIAATPKQNIVLWSQTKRILSDSTIVPIPPEGWSGPFPISPIKMVVGGGGHLHNQILANKAPNAHSLGYVIFLINHSIHSTRGL